MVGTIIEWKKIPDEPWEKIEEDTFLIYLLNSNRVVSATHDAMNRYFSYTTEDAEHVFSYSCISHYAEMDWPDIDDGPMISWCEHGKMLVCDECANRAKIERETRAARKLLSDDYIIVPLTSWNNDVDEHKKLIAEVERLQNELNGRNKLIELEWEVIVGGAKLIQSTYITRSLSWLKYQRLLDRYYAGERSDELKEALSEEGPQ